MDNLGVFQLGWTICEPDNLPTIVHGSSMTICVTGMRLRIPVTQNFHRTRVCDPGVDHVVWTICDLTHTCGMDNLYPWSALAHDVC